MKLKNLMVAVRANFLLLAVVLGFLGASLAWYEHQEYGSGFSLGFAFLAGAGLVLAHISVNVFNDYFDSISRLDYKTPRTPFSGGSKAIVDGLITARQALWLAIGSLAVAAAVGIFFTVTQGLLLLPLLLVSAVIILIYTPFITQAWLSGMGGGTGTGDPPHSRCLFHPDRRVSYCRAHRRRSVRDTCPQFASA